ncbi:MAG: hypothetical protein FWF59_15635 [Turicibacter sp.]|nr:hypothetical protein [Turicibacter sp.]
MVQVATLIPMIVGISQVIKNMGCPGKWIPLINLFIGVALSFLVFHGLQWHEQIMQGLVVGLSAGGIYDQSKNLNETFTKQGESGDA